MITRGFCIQVRNFKAGLELFKRIGEVAEAEGHHPDLHLQGYNQVYAVMSTHSVGRLPSQMLPTPRIAIMKVHASQ